jgi:phosphatidylinositol dimannoside acyltransferase
MGCCASIVGRLGVWAAYPAYRLAAWAACRIPRPLVGLAAALGGRLAAAAMPSRRRLVRRHVRRVQGSTLTGSALRRAVVAVFVSYARYWLDTFRLATSTPAAVAARFDVEGFDHLDDALAAGHGAVVAVPHLGSFDAAGVYLAARGYRPVTVTERIQPPRLFDWFVAARRAAGIGVVPPEPGILATLEAALADGHVVALVGDRDLGRRGVEVDFFGERTTLPAGPARLALTTGAPLLPAAAYFTDRGYRAVIRPPLAVTPSGDLRTDVTQLTQHLADAFEALIRAAPEQWHLTQPNWPDDS